MKPEPQRGVTTVVLPGSHLLENGGSDSSYKVGVNNNMGAIFSIIHIFQRTSYQTIINHSVSSAVKHELDKNKMSLQDKVKTASD